MKTFKIHNAETAPVKSKPLLEKSIQSFGYIPNLHGVMAEAPAALESYQRLHQEFLNTSFTAEEKTVI